MSQHLSIPSAGKTPSDIANQILTARADGRTLVAAYHAPSGFIHFDGQDADNVIAPALGMRPGVGSPARALESRMNEPYGSLGVAEDSPLLARLEEARIVMVAVCSVFQMKETQLLVDAGVRQAAPRKLPQLPTPQGATPALSVG